MVSHAKITALFLLLVACTPFPDPGGRLSAARNEGAGEAPALIPVGELLARADRIAVSEAIPRTIAARVASLQARAARLRGPVVDGATRARMARGVR